ncbi:MAG TPA: hypothetical protein DEP45_08255 [Armatimonadetes bacterium]|nr:hypothetical protein [Armatimonadota bacterium]
MRKTQYNWLLALILIAAVHALPAHAIDMYVSGGWTTLTITASDLVGEAGSGLVSTYDSDPATAALDVANTSSSSDAWRIEVRRSESASWSDSCRVLIRRTSDGSGAGFVSGGTIYQEVGLIGAAFFDGSGDRLGINLQVRIDGVSVSDGPSMYSSDLVLTVVDL